MEKEIKEFILVCSTCHRLRGIWKEKLFSPKVGLCYKGQRHENLTFDKRYIKIEIK